MSEKLAGWGLKVGRFALKSWQVETESWQVGGPPLDSKIYRNPDLNKSDHSKKYE